MDSLFLLALLGLAGAGVHLIFMQKEIDRLDRDLFRYKNLASTGKLDELIQTNEDLVKRSSSLQQRLSNLENDFLKLLLKAFNTEVEDAILKVKPINIQSSEERIVRSFKNLNKLSETATPKIPEKHLDLKLSELHHQYEMACQKQRDNERDKEIRKDEDERRKFMKAEEEVKKAEQKEEVSRQKIERIRQKIQQVEGERHRQLELDNNRLQLQLQSELEKAKVELAKAEVELEKDEVETEQTKLRLRVGKEGRIYVISNVGSLGHGIYRICKSRSVREDDFISEMNPALPFPFDIHLKVYSEDATGTLKLLHSQFQSRRVNLHNNRREFFQVSIDEIYQAINEINRQTGILNILSYEPKAQAYEYRETVAERNKKPSSKTTGNYDRNATA